MFVIKRISNSPKFITFAALLCFIHCLLVPLLVPLIPSLSFLFDSHLFEILIIFSSIFFGYIIINHGYSQHKKTQIKSLFLSGCVFWLFHLLFEYFHFPYAFSFLVIGSVLVAASYLYNYSCLKQCQNICCK